MSSKNSKSGAIDLAEIFGGARENYCRCLKRCRKKFSDKAVHKLRVETRRLLAMLDFFELARIGATHDKLRKILKKRLDAFDDLRDTHVELQLLEPLWPDYPEAKPFKKFLKRHERKLIKAARKKLADTGARKLSCRFKDFQREICDSPRAKTPVENVATGALQKSFSEVAALRRKIRGRDVAAIHKMRVAFKRFRYMSELLQPFLPWITDARLDAMRQFQSRAGGIQDLEVLLARIEGLAGKRRFSDEAPRRLKSELARRKKRALDFFLNRMDDLFEFQPPQK